MKEKKKYHFLSCCSSEREKNGDKVNFQNFSLRSTKIGWLEFVGPKMKVHLLEEGYAWIPKTQNFVENSSEKFGKSKVSGLGSVHWTSWGFFYSLRGRDSSYFGLFFILRAVWLCFMPKGLFGRVFP